MKPLAWILIVAAAAFVGCSNGPAGGSSDAETGGAEPLAARTGDPTGEGDAPDVFPRMPPVEHLVVFDARATDLPTRYLLTSLQGVVNRSEPRIFLIVTAYENDSSQHERFWLDEMIAYFGVTAEWADSEWDLLDRFGDEVAGMIVYDPDEPGTINIGTMLAGQRDAVLVHPSLVEPLAERGFLLLEDLRGRFESTVEMYTWAFENLWAESNHAILAYLDPSICTLRDYLVAQRIFILGLDPHRADERALLERIYDETPRDIPVLGWVVDELLGVQLLSKYGKFHNASDHVANFSVHAGLEPIVPPLAERPPLPVLENRIYVSFAYGDGDNASYIHRSMLDQWSDPARGSVPLGWELNASLLDMSPATYHYYRRTATSNDAVIGPVSGIGYMYPNLYPDMPAFLEITRIAWERHEYENIWIINDDLTLSDEITTAYSAALDVEGIFVDYWPNGDRGWYLASDGTPVLRSQYVYLVGPDQLALILENAAVEKEYHYPDQPTFVFIGVNAWATPPTMVKAFVDELDDRYRVVRPDDMLSLVVEAYGEGN